MAVRQNSDVRWRSGGTPTSGGGPAELRRWSWRSLLLLFSSSLLFFSSCLGSLFKKNEGSIYRFL
ncbi:hypothetical protein M5K25_015178 [Dendrobium thyrsiflorum]|uniref:Uncharacterized protein n=1 Tax=Dendrobium thyrsiflorum TaxID=117978 RepID=A0ABD0UWQ2_DENTH